MPDQPLPESLDTRAISEVGCPRCGYDQRGVIVTWSHQCPMDGRCSECGLEFRWSEVICAHKYEPRWCVEFVPRWRQIPIASVKTYVRSLWPWRFWSRLNMSFRVRPWRIAACMLVLIVLPILPAYVIAQATVAVGVRWMIADELQQTQQQSAAIIQSLLLSKQKLTLAPWACAQWELQRSSSIDWALAWHQSVMANPTTVEFSYPAAALEAVVFPLSEESKGVLHTAMGDLPYPAPNELWSTFLPGFTQWNTSGASSPVGVRLSHAIERIVFVLPPFGLGLILLLALPATFVLLPVSRRRARVRWAHIGRVTAYSLFIPSTVLLLGLLTIIPGVFASSQTMIGLLDVTVGLLIGAGPLLLLVIWWAVAIKRYLRMPHGAAIAVLMTILSVLVLASIVFWGGQMIYGRGY